MSRMKSLRSGVGALIAKRLVPPSDVGPGPLPVAERAQLGQRLLDRALRLVDDGAGAVVAVGVASAGGLAEARVADARAVERADELPRHGGGDPGWAGPLHARDRRPVRDGDLRGGARLGARGLRLAEAGQPGVPRHAEHPEG